MTLGSCSPDVSRVHFFIESISVFDKYLDYYTIDIFVHIGFWLKLFLKF